MNFKWILPEGDGGLPDEDEWAGPTHGVYVCTDTDEVIGTIRRKSKIHNNKPNYYYLAEVEIACPLNYRFDRRFISSEAAKVFIETAAAQFYTGFQHKEGPVA